MKIILVEDVPNLGVLGDQVQVKPGYARNYLIPQGKAILATSKKSKELQHRLQYLEKLRQAAVEHAQGEASKIKVLELEITKKAGSGGRLFGSVTTKEIAELLTAKGFEVTRRNVVTYEPIKAVGNHTVNVKLHTSVKVDINVKVVAEAIEEAPAAAAPTDEIPETDEEFVDDVDDVENQEEDSTEE